MPKMPYENVYKWEQNNRGLDHSCGVCKSALSNPRARKTCIGIHEEACFKYHKTLFRLGSSHKCDACRSSNEQHDKRHRVIALLAKKLLPLDPSTIPKKGKKSEKYKSALVISNEDMQKVHEAIHPITESAAKTQQRIEPQMPKILCNLGITTCATSMSTKEEEALLACLRDAISEDIICVGNENRETMVRMAGYWRYVSRRTFNAMVRNHDLWDWATGKRLDEIVEEDEVSDNNTNETSTESSHR